MSSAARPFPLPLLLLLSFLAFAASRTPPPEGDEPAGVVLVVGRAEDTSVRILLDCGPTSRCPRSLTISHRAESQPKWDMRDTFTISRPTVVTVNSLQACTTYELRLLAEDEGATDPTEEFVAAAHFSTRCESKPLTLAVLSCDRFADDPEDDAFVWQLAETLEKERTFMTLHLGDQVYADQIFEKYGESSLEKALAAFRDLYRRAWTRPAMRKVLRHGTHIMVPDDHDLFNAITPLIARTHQHRRFVRAAEMAIYEYQMNLYEDQKVSAHLMALPRAAFTHLHYGSLGIVIVDTRFYRSIAEPDLPFELTGRKQLREFEELMAFWKEQQHVDEVLVLTSVPLLYPSVPMAKVANWFEGDRYPNHPSHQNNTLALLERMWKLHTSGKNVTMIAGDVHMHLEMRVCRQNLTSGEEQGCMPAYATSGLQHLSSAASMWHLALYDSILYWFTPIELRAPDAHVTYHGPIDRMALVNNYMLLEKGNVGTRLKLRFVDRIHPLSHQLRHFFMFRLGAWLSVLVLLTTVGALVTLCARFARRRVHNKGPQSPRRGGDDGYGYGSPKASRNNDVRRRKFFD